METNTKTVHIIDDDQSVRNYLTELLTLEQYQVKTYESANHFLEEFKEDGIGCLIIDLRLPGISGLDLQQKLTNHDIDLPFIMITGHGDVQTAVRAMKAGAIDFIEKPINAQLLLERVHNAMRTHQLSRDDHSMRNEILTRMRTLTAREHEVMNLVVTGLQNKDIANRLGISIKTVEVHRSNVMEKMQAGSIVELVRMCLIIKKDPGDKALH